jgi:hypothetical protein
MVCERERGRERGERGERESFIELSMVSSGCRLFTHFVKAGNLRRKGVGVKEEEVVMRR